MFVDLTEIKEANLEESKPSRSIVHRLVVVFIVNSLLLFEVCFEFACSRLP